MPGLRASQSSVRQVRTVRDAELVRRPADWHHCLRPPFLTTLDHQAYPCCLAMGDGHGRSGPRRRRQSPGNLTSTHAVGLPTCARQASQLPCTPARAAERPCTFAASQPAACRQSPSSGSWCAVRGSWGIPPRQRSARRRWSGQRDPFSPVRSRASSASSIRSTPAATPLLCASTSNAAAAARPALSRSWSRRSVSRPLTGPGLPSPPPRRNSRRASRWRGLQGHAALGSRRSASRPTAELVRRKIRWRASTGGSRTPAAFRDPPTLSASR
jgi:hypothetical protein